MYDIYVTNFPIIAVSLSVSTPQAKLLVKLCSPEKKLVLNQAEDAGR